MKFSTEDRALLAKIAKSIDVPEAAFLAVVAVESNGIPGEMIGGRLEPLVRYEGHYFDKLCAPSIREAARAAKVSSPKVKGIPNPKSQINRWALIKKAATFDREAAYASASYGVGQVMGAHWKKLGFKSIDAFLEKARSGLAGQAELMAKYIKEFGLDDELRALDWSAFARGYNGPGYRDNKYDTKMAEAYHLYGGTDTVVPTRSGYLRLGSQGAGVRDLQAMLVLAGYKINIDGDFGTTTKEAVMAWQTKNNLKADGIVGPKTQQSLVALRSLAPQDAGQQTPIEVKEVQQGAGVAVLLPTILNGIQGELTELIQKISPYAYMGKITEYLQTGIAVISVVSIAAGAGYALYGWYQSKKSFTGTKVSDPIIVTTVTDEQLVLPHVG